MKKSKTSVKIPKMDLCQTPGYGIEPLIEALNSLSGWTIWECATGQGYMANALENAGASVVRSDIEEDFLSDYYPYEFPFSIDAVITNPPFSLKKEFTRKALELSHEKQLCVALLMQSEVVSTKWFGDLVTDYGEPGIIWFNPRINFKMPNKEWEGSGSHFSTAWFTWGWFTGNRFVRMDHWTKEYRERFET